MIYLSNTFYFLCLFCSFLNRSGKKICTLAILCLIIFKANATDDHVKLEKALESAQDTARLTILKELCLKYQIRDPARSLDYGQQGLQLAISLNMPSRIAYLHNAIGVTYVYQQNHDKAAYHQLEALQIFQKQNNEKGEAKTIFDMAAMYKMFDNEYDTAIAYYEKAYVLFKKLKDDKLIINSLNALGIVNSEAKRYDEAEGYFHQMLKEAKARNFVVFEANAMKQLAWNFYNQKKYEQSALWYEKAGQYELDRENEEGYASIMLNMSVVYVKLGEMNKALNASDESVEIYERTGNNYKLTQALRNRTWLMMKRKSYRSAIEIGINGLEFSKMIGSKHMTSNFYEYLHQCYDSLGLPDQALEYYKKYVSVNDSIQNENRIKKIAQIRSIFDLDLKNAEISRQKTAVAYERNQKYFLIAVIIFVLLIGALFVNKQRVSIKLKEANSRIREIRLDQLQKLNNHLETELDQKNREIVSYSINFVQKNNLINDIKNELSGIQVKSEESLRQTLQKVKNKTSVSKRIDQEWEHFKAVFEQMHPGFFTEMAKKYSKLTANDLKICALAKLNLSSKEIASICDMTPHSLKVARYRIRKKLEMDSDQGFNEFFMLQEKTAG